MEYGSGSYVKVIGSRSKLQKQKLLFPQYKTSVDNNAGSTKQSYKVCVQLGVFDYGRSNGVIAIFFT